MAVPLVLHAGMHKTGTTAIQRFLADGLSDPRFCHVGCGLANASRPLHAFVSDSPHKHPSHRQQGLSARAVRRLRLQWQTRWWQQLAQARDTGVTPIVSAEDCCVFSGAELQLTWPPEIGPG